MAMERNPIHYPNWKRRSCVLSDFRGAALLIGPGEGSSPAARRAMKMALMLSHPDGAAYPVEHLHLVFDPSPTSLHAPISALSNAAAPRPFDTLCVYVRQTEIFD